MCLTKLLIWLLRKDGECFCTHSAACTRVNESGGGWSVLSPCGSVMESSSGVSVACAWECSVGPQQVLLLVAHVGGRADPGSVPCSGSLLNRSVWEDHHVIRNASLELL